MLAAPPADYPRLLADIAPEAALPLGWALTHLSRTDWHRDPTRAIAAADILAWLVHRHRLPELDALAAWTAGIAALAHGQMEPALTQLDAALAQFEALAQTHAAATVQVARMLALSMLGRYAEAITTGMAVRAVFLAASDLASAGLVELNLGNIYDRRDQYSEAAHFFQTARARFVDLDDPYALLQADNGLANVLSQQRQIQAATALYEQVLARAERLQAAKTQAMVECNLGNLALDQGRYAEALRYLEQSRRRYAQLELPHEEALAERELADAYMELNLIPEAIAIYTRLAPVFADLKMLFEQAWTLAQHGRAMLLAGHFATARPLLVQAQTLFIAEHNTTCLAFVLMLEAQRLHGQAIYAEAEQAARRAAELLAQGGPLSWLVFAHWLTGDAARLGGHPDVARATLQIAHDLAHTHALSQIVYRCATSLGLLAVTQADQQEAIAAFTQAITCVETLRAPLPADEFRTAFFADKLTPYTELARLCLDDQTPDGIVAALTYVEQARARALADLLRSEPAAPSTSNGSHDPAEDTLHHQLVARRAELNWLYSQITRAFAEDDPDRLARLDVLQVQARQCEEDILTWTRQMRQSRDTISAADLKLDIATLQQDLGSDTTLVAYAAFGDELVVFVVTEQTVQTVRQPAQVPALRSAVEHLRFQTDTFRHGVARMRSHMQQLTRRARRHLGHLYDILIRPLEPLLHGQRLLVVPHGVMHYLPFAALYNGTHYLIERYEISLTPSIDIWQHSRQTPPRPKHTALLVGVPDEHAPQVRAEVEQLQALWPTAIVLTDTQATIEQVQQWMPQTDIVHLACHGQFRPDNPLFSALRLADGWLTVQDTHHMRLKCYLVTLSACETGVALIAPGDELLGLVRGFLSAGAQHVLVSLWTVDDAVTTRLMHTFYSHLCAGERPSKALQSAQRALLLEDPHPFFWSPFVLLGP